MIPIRRAWIAGIVVPFLLLAFGASAGTPGPHWYPGFPLRTAESVVLMWTPVPGATAYRLMKKTGDGEFREVYRGQGTMYTDPGASADATIAYNVVAVLKGKESDPSPMAVLPAAEKLVAPVVTGAIPSTEAITLRWTVAPNTAFSKIYRAESDEGPFALHDSIRLNTYVDRKVSKGKTYYYRVSAVDAFNKESPQSVSVRASLLEPSRATDDDVPVVRKVVPAGVFSGGEHHRLDQPGEIGFGAKGELLVVDRVGLNLFDLDGRPQKTIRFAKGWGLPSGFAQDRDGGYLIPSFADQSVRKIDDAGEVVARFGYPPYQKVDPERPADSTSEILLSEREGIPNSPNDIAVDADGFYWIVDGVRNQVIKTDGSGKALKILGRMPAFPGRKAPKAPELPGVRRIYFNRHNGLLYAALGVGAQIKIIDPRKGEIIGAFGGMGKKKGNLQSVGGLAFRSNGNILVLDILARVIKEFGPSLQYVATYADMTGRNRPTLSADYPTDLAFREEIRRFYVTSAIGNQVYMFDARD